MIKSGLTLYSTYPTNYLAQEKTPSGSLLESQTVSLQEANSLTLEQNKILAQNFKTIIFLMVLGFASMYFLLKR